MYKKNVKATKMINFWENSQKYPISNYKQKQKYLSKARYIMQNAQSR